MKLKKIKQWPHHCTLDLWKGQSLMQRCQVITTVNDNDSVDRMTFFDTLSSCAKDGDFMMSIGSTLTSDLPTLEAVSDDSDSDAFESDSDTEED